MNEQIMVVYHPGFRILSLYNLTGHKSNELHGDEAEQLYDQLTKLMDKK